MAKKIKPSDLFKGLDLDEAIESAKIYLECREEVLSTFHKLQQDFIKLEEAAYSLIKTKP